MKILTHILGIILGLSLSNISQAHIKWFVEYDISAAPTPLTQLASPLFFSLLILSIWGITLGAYIDSRWTKFRYFSLMPYFKTDSKDLPLSIIRIATGIFFVALWLVGGTTLTPDLITEEPIVPIVQMLIAFAILFRPTLILAGLGILGLYGYSIYLYGFFHMLDYAFFIALGAFLIITPINNPTLNRFRLPLIYWLIGLSFMWSAVEKIAFPQWFDPFLDKNSFLQMGLDRSLFIMAAAFVELSLFYTLIRFRNGVAIIALLANLLIMSGNFYFGKIDALGHFPANAMLLVITIVGNIRPLNKKQWSSYCALKITIEFIIMLIVIFSLYYLIHWLEYGS